MHVKYTDQLPKQAFEDADVVKVLVPDEYYEVADSGMIDDVPAVYLVGFTKPLLAARFEIVIL